LAGYLQRAHQILVFTGAGISTASPDISQAEKFLAVVAGQMPL